VLWKRFEGVKKSTIVILSAAKDPRILYASALYEQLQGSFAALRMTPSDFLLSRLSQLGYAGY